MNNLLARAIKGALKSGNKAGKFKAMEDDETLDDENIGDEENTDEDSEGDDEEDVDADGDDEENTAAEGDEEEKPDAIAFNAGVKSGVKNERARCAAIFGHKNANISPDTTAKLFANGTSKSDAAGLLDTLTGATATKSGGSLAERVRNSQGNKRPGQDAAGKSGVKGNTLNDKMAAMNHAAQQKK